MDHRPDSDDMLIARAQAGDGVAFDALVERHQSVVRSFLAARAPSAECVEECLQQAFVTAWERLATFHGDGPFPAWVIGIARLRLLGELRRWRSGMPAEEADRAGRLVDACMSDADPALDERVSRLKACLDRISPEARDLLRRRYADGIGVDELAASIGRGANALAASLYRLRNILRTCVEQGGR